MYSNVRTGGIGPVGFSDADLAELAAVVNGIESAERELAAAEVRRTRLLARAGEVALRQTATQERRIAVRDMALRGVAAEIAGPARRSDRAVQAQIGEALMLVENYPVAMAAWETAQITSRHVREITHAGATLPLDALPAFDAAAVEICTTDIPSRVRPRLEMLAADLHPDTLSERHAAAAQSRRVRTIAVGEGMSDVIATVPTVLAVGIEDRLTQQARVIADTRSSAVSRLRELADKDGADADQERSRLEAITSDTRTMDQLRADLLCDLLLTAMPAIDPTRTDDGPGALGAIRAHVQITIPATALLGADAPADLVGRCPIDAQTARALAAQARGPWERVIIHPVTGVALHTDTYQRTAAMDRHLKARDGHCRFPGCRIPAIRCEVDHTVDWARGGVTDIGNLAHLCQRHHSMKQFTPWKVRQLPGGVLEWTSPLGVTGREHPPAHTVRFVAADSPPPF